MVWLANKETDSLAAGAEIIWHEQHNPIPWSSSVMNVFSLLSTNYGNDIFLKDRLWCSWQQKWL
jgi:hypothetical protein